MTHSPSMSRYSHSYKAHAMNSSFLALPLALLLVNGAAAADNANCPGYLAGTWTNLSEQAYGADIYKDLLIIAFNPAGTIEVTSQFQIGDGAADVATRVGTWTATAGEGAAFCSMTAKEDGPRGQSETVIFELIDDNQMKMPGEKIFVRSVP